MLKEGDVRRGKEFFGNEEKLACSKCHSVDGTSGKAGPDLFAIGDKFGRREIIDAVLSPSATIAIGYSTTTLDTKSGEAYQGVIKKITDSWIELMGADANPIRVATADLQERQTSEASLMPEELQAGLTLQEFADLVEYLVSLKQPERAATVYQGMPNVIPQLEKQVALRPFHTEQNKFEHLVCFSPLPGCSDTFLVAEHETGKIWRLTKNGVSETKTLFADLGRCMKGTKGLLGLTFHPKFRENRKYYLVQHVLENGQLATLLLEREAALDLQTDSGKPSRRLLKIDGATNNNCGGGLAFGPDGYCYVGMGDTGPSEDPNGNGQNPSTLLGKILRIDLDHCEPDRPYAVPRDNPFVGQAGVRPEIWALGLREPWRITFDPATGDLWLGDVGQDRYEEVAIVRRGENHGWNVYESFERFSNRYRKENATYALPIFAYGRKFGVSVTGGYVYRGDPKSSFNGVYIFGDHESRRIFGLTQEDRVLKKIRQIGTAPQRIVSFSTDERGALYLVGYDGIIYSLDFDQAVFE